MLETPLLGELLVAFDNHCGPLSEIMTSGTPCSDITHFVRLTTVCPVACPLGIFMIMGNFE